MEIRRNCGSYSKWQRSRFRGLTRIGRGLGRLDGDEFTVDWSAIASGGGTGSGRAIYTVQPDGRLVGVKTVDGAASEGTEEIFPDP